MNISLGAAEAVESSPSSCSSWMAGSRPNHDPASVSLTRFAGCKAYGVESLRGDLAASYSCSAAPSNGARRR